MKLETLKVNSRALKTKKAKTNSKKELRELLK